ncbi:DUF550 domain-containing protein [Salmonella enterica subsp. enterica]|nr:DUF550 domain-containing protein [Salmonella enterica subsp. enterica]
MTTITKEWLQQTIAEFENTRDDIPFGLSDDDAKVLIVLKRALASLDAEPVRYLNKFSGTCVTLEQQPNASDDVAVYVPLYAAPPASERERIRREHAEWSDKTFGDVGPVGPLKHLSKEALEAAAEPEDLSEWADMQFLLWDAQRRAGITDKQITLAMVEKLAVNKKREWPEPKDGEPRLHIKEQPAPVVPEEKPKGLAGQIVSLLAHNIGDKFLAQKIWNACRDAMLNGDTFRENSISSTNNFREIAETSTNSPVSPDGWISCSERMPEDEQEVIVHNKLGYRYVSYFDEHSGLFFDMRGGNQMNCIEHLLVTHWRPMPAPPQQ